MKEMTMYHEKKANERNTQKTEAALDKDVAFLNQVVPGCAHAIHRWAGD